MTSERHLDRSNPTPLYHQLQSELEQRILAGEFQIGDPLPSSEELCAAYDISGITVRKAIGNMAQAGIVKRIPGKGSFVTAVPALPLRIHNEELVFRMFLAPPLNEYIKSSSFQEDLKEVLPGFRIETHEPLRTQATTEFINNMDLAMVSDLEIKALISQKEILPWDSVISKSEKATLHASWLGEIPRLFGDTQLNYFLPVVLSPIVLFYNATLFKEYKLPDIPQGESVEKFLELGSQILDIFNRTPQITRYPLLLELSSIRRWPLAIYAKGGRIWSQDNGLCLLDTKATAEAMRLYHEMIYERKIAINVFQPINNLEQLAFSKGIAAMHFGTYPFLKAYEQLEDFEVRTAHVPLNPEGSTTLVSGGLTIPRSSRYPELAWKVAQLFLSEKHQKQLLASRLHLPSNRNAIQNWLTHSATASQKKCTDTFLQSLKQTTPIDYAPDFDKQQTLSLLMSLVWLDIPNAPARCREVAARINATNPIS